MTRTPEQVHQRLMDIFQARPDMAMVVNEVVTELMRAEQLHPHWPFDAVHASAVLNEEAGELTKECNDFMYAKDSSTADLAMTCMENEATQATAMGLRFLLHLDNYKAHGRQSHA